MSEYNFDTTSAEEAVLDAQPEQPEEEAPIEKPYKFRLLGAPDIFLMAKIISKIGLKEFKACFEGEGIKGLIAQAFIDKTAEQAEGENGEQAEGENDDFNIISVGAGVTFEIVSVILGNLDKCEADIYQMLAQTSNLSVNEIKAPGNAAMFLEMVIDFVKKDEFKDFIKVVSKLFK